MTAVIFALFIATPSFAEPTELDKKTVASKAYVDTKQDIIETDLVSYYSIGDDETKQVPSLVSYDSTNGLNGNQIGILDYENIYNDGWNGLTGSEMDNFVPTVRAVAEEIARKQNRLPAARTDTTNPYTMASTGGETIALTATEGLVFPRYITAGGSQPLTQKAGADNVILYINGTKTLAQYQTSNFGATVNQNYVNGALVSLELLKDVYGELNSKITNNALPTGTTGTVVTYNGTNATTGVQEFGETAMTGTVTYTNGVLNNANNIATITAVGTRQKKKECGGYEPAAAGQPAHDGTHPGDEDYCWLWIFPED